MNTIKYKPKLMIILMQLVVQAIVESLTLIKLQQIF